MKPNPKASLFSLLFFSLASLAANAQENLSTNDKCFVQMNDGTIRHFTSLKMVTGIMITPHLVANGNEIINGKDIKAYRDNEHYAVSQKTFNSGRKTYLATEVLPGFVQKITSGSISIYAKQSFNGFRKIEEFYLQDGIDAPIVPYAPKFSSKDKSMPLSERLQAVADILNNLNLVSRN